MKKKKIILGMSGGVDSSVAALLLQKKGYEVIGMFMDSRNKNLPTSISWDEELNDVKEVCDKLKIKLIVKKCGEGYEKKIINKMIEDYSSDLTPNPDILCNNIGKFPLLYSTMKEEKADFISTGHYARTKIDKKNFELITGKDKNKDQSYFIARVPKKYLQKTIFPIGELTKKEVRKIAKNNGFKNWNKRGSRGVCYLGKINFKEFLKKKIKSIKGKIYNSQNEEIGQHTGSNFFTIGETLTQNKEITLNKRGKKLYSSKKLYVYKKKKNSLYVCEKNNEKLLSNTILIKNIKFLNNPEESYGKNLKARIRHLGEFYPGKLAKIKEKNIFNFKNGVSGVAPGQSIVLHKGQNIIASGEIKLLS